MSKSFKALIFFGILSIFLLGNLAAQQPLADKTRATGLIPLDAKQLEEVLTTWPRVDRVNFNWLGLKRINKVKALKGKTLLAPSAAKPVGQEVESSIYAAGAPAPMFVLNEDLVGDLPPYVDNSTDLETGLHFPPIRDQGTLGSCGSFATTYYQLSYMTAFKRGLDIRNGEDNTNKYSPKWSYNMLNDGANSGTNFAESFSLLEKHGAGTWAEFPYDTDYLAWCLDTTAWRNALSVRTKPTQYSWHTDTDAGLEVIKQLLSNGYILVFGTYINSWYVTYIQDDPSTPYDDSAVGKYVGYWVNGTVGGHAMTIVGYNDAIWTDINGNGTIDAGEKGALRIANSWGTDWNPADGGFIWLAYDALKGVSAVPGGPSTGRQAAFWDQVAYVLTARDNYSPSLIAEFTVNHAKRNELTMRLGTSATTATTPSTTWTATALAAQGGAYAFDGTAIAVDGTFVLDYSNILPSTGDLRRFYLTMIDSTGGDTATLSAFKIIDYTTEPDTEVVCNLVPQYADATTVYSYVEHTYAGSTYNNPPVASNGYVNPATGTNLDTFNFVVWYYDADGNVPTVKQIYIDGTPYTLDYYWEGSISASNGWYRYVTTLGVGTHNFRYYFEDHMGGYAQDPISLNPPPYSTYSGPVVVLAHYVTTPSTPAGEQSPVKGLSYTYSTSGSTCYQGHNVQYKFDWGDGTTSDWLAVGMTNAQHTWNSSGVFNAKAQARCSVDNTILSSWSSGLSVSVAVTPLLAESFSASTFPTGWIQQNIGTTNRWNVNNTNNAGGQAYEMRCSWTSGTGTTRLVTPAIDTTGRSALFLSFKHFHDAFLGGPQLKVQTSPDGTTWTDEAWVVTTTTANIGPETVITTLTHNLNIATTYVAFTLTGNLAYFDDWYIDDVSICADASSPKRKVDFNKDGQEDILWRYQGTGDLQGWNCVWLMNQTEGLSPIPLGIAQQETGSMNLLKGAAPGLSYETPLDVGNPKALVRVKSFRTPMGGGKSLTPKPKKIMMNPMEDGRKLPLRANGRTQAKNLVNVPTMRGANMVSAAGDGKIELASLAVSGVLYPQSVPDLGWEIAGTGDFNGDGNTDILWRNYGSGAHSGYNCIWYMSGVGVIGYGYPDGVLDLDWRIVGTGDFNRDGNTDILWRNYGSGEHSGFNCIWYMSGGGVSGYGYPYRVLDLDWKIAGTGDFNGDGNTDILWRNYGSGEFQGWNCIWYMSGEGNIDYGFPYRVLDLNWEIVGTEDFNRDGYTDILWRYYGSGELQGWNCVWYMQREGMIGVDYPMRVPDTNWRIVNR